MQKEIYANRMNRGSFTLGQSYSKDANDQMLKTFSTELTHNYLTQNHKKQSV